MPCMVNKAITYKPKEGNRCSSAIITAGGKIK
jgi:hypothetical protein